MFNIDDLLGAAQTVYSQMRPTPQYNWPQLSEFAGCNVWVKHENHTPTGAFKVRGGIVLLNKLKSSEPMPPGIMSATRGNHGQSLSFAASKAGIPVKIVVPQGNDEDQNCAIKCFGADLIIHGNDFEEARQHSLELQCSSGFQAIAPFQQELVLGVATYAYELFQGAQNLDTVYVPIGMGSGICGLIRTRDLLGLKTKIVGVVSTGAPAFALSFEAGKPVSTPTADTFAGGVATRAPMDEAFEIIKHGTERIIKVTDDQIAHAMYLLYQTTHNLSEGAGAVSLAGLISEKENMSGKNVGVVLSGGNINFETFSEKVRPFVTSEKG